MNVRVSKILISKRETNRWGFYYRIAQLIFFGTMKIPTGHRYTLTYSESNKLYFNFATILFDYKILVFIFATALQKQERMIQ